jgi:hypothetical protein
MSLRDYYLKEELVAAQAEGLEDPLRFQHKQMMDEAFQRHEISQGHVPPL